MRKIGEPGGRFEALPHARRRDGPSGVGAMAGEARAPVRSQVLEEGVVRVDVARGGDGLSRAGRVYERLQEIVLSFAGGDPGPPHLQRPGGRPPGRHRTFEPHVSCGCSRTSFPPVLLLLFLPTGIESQLILMTKCGRSGTISASALRRPSTTLSCSWHCCHRRIRRDESRSRRIGLFDALTFRGAFRSAARTTSRPRAVLRVCVEGEELGDGDITAQGSAAPQSVIGSVPLGDNRRRHREEDSRHRPGPAARAAPFIEKRSDIIWSSFTETQCLRLQSGGSGTSYLSPGSSFP